MASCCSPARVIVVNAAISHVSFAWLVSTQHYKDRMLENGLWAVGALAIGVGVLPMIAGIAGLIRPRGEPWSRELRAVVATIGSLLVGFGWYTAIKAAYISTTFSTLVVERNLIYVTPLLFVGTAMFFERPLTRWWAVAGAAGLTLAAMLLAYPYQMQLRIYSDAPGLALLQAANRTYAWTPDHARDVLIGFVVLSLVVIVLPRVLPWGTRQVLALVAVLLLVWGVAGQMSAASASNTLSEELSADIDQPFNWIDRATGGAPTLYLGQRLTDFNGIWQMEFWNRSLNHIWSTDGSAPGPRADALPRPRQTPGPARSHNPRRRSSTQLSTPASTSSARSLRATPTTPPGRRRSGGRSRSSRRSGSRTRRGA